jgi:hypothetical protein
VPLVHRIDMPPRNPEANMAALEAEMLAEAAHTLGLAGQRMERALAALAACPPDRQPLRRELLDAASSATYAYVVQREAMGMRDTAYALDVYAVPPEVRASMGRHLPPPPATPPDDPLAYFERRNRTQR